MNAHPWNQQDFFEIHPEIQMAIENHQPMIALESTLLTHGLPKDRAHSFAGELERIARKAGVVPATIAVLGGKIKVGLTDSELAQLIDLGPKCEKAAAFDLPWIIAQKTNASTTVSATLKIAAEARISVFATGGIGGVHRGFEENLDISHDLAALTKYPTILVTAGAKAILDLRATVELLETKGVLVVGFGTEQFPAFYYRDSGIPLAHSTNTVAPIVKAFQIGGGRQSIVVANPVPLAAELPKNIVEPLISDAIEEAKFKTSGKCLTPFLLGKIQQLSHERSVKCNEALVTNNVQLASTIARSLDSKHHKFQL